MYAVCTSTIVILVHTFTAAGVLHAPRKEQVPSAPTMMSTLEHVQQACCGKTAGMAASRPAHAYCPPARHSAALRVNVMTRRSEGVLKRLSNPTKHVPPFAVSYLNPPFRSFLFFLVLRISSLSIPSVSLFPSFPSFLVEAKLFHSL
jgi:hypothetical protein